MLTKISEENLKIKMPKFKYNGLSFLAGGCIRDSLLGEKYNDIDVFGIPKGLDLFIEENLKEDYSLVYQNELIKTYKCKDLKIQLIYRDAGYSEKDDLETLIHKTMKRFDFTIAQFALSGTDLYCQSDAIIHLFNKKLIVNAIPFPYDTLRRMQKYIKRGYSICDGGLLQICEAIRNMTKEDLEQAVNFYSDGTPRIVRFD